MGTFEPSAFLMKLDRVSTIPNNLGEVTISALIKVVIKALPQRSYDLENIELRHNHILGIRVLTKFMQLSI